MGTWGASITANDTAEELKDEYYAAFSYYDVPTALEKIDQYVRTMFDERDEIEWCAYYYSLANFMWKKGILTDGVRAKALQMVESDYGIQEWVDAGKAALKERHRELDKFVKRITSPQCAPKKIKVSLRPDDVFTDGEVIAIELKTDDKKYIQNNDDSAVISDEKFLAYNKKLVVIQKVCSEVTSRSFVVPEVYERTVYFRLFEGTYSSVEEINIDALKAIPIMEDGNYIHLCFRLDNNMSKFKKRNCKVLGMKKLSKIDKNVTTRYFDMNWNYPYLNFDSEFLDILVDKKFMIGESNKKLDYATVKMIISLVVDRELGPGCGLSSEEYKELYKKKKLLIEERIGNLDKMISNGAKLFELKFGELLLGIGVKSLGKTAVIYMRSDDEEHRKMLQEFIDSYTE